MDRTGFTFASYRVMHQTAEIETLLSIPYGAKYAPTLHRNRQPIEKRSGSAAGTDAQEGEGDQGPSGEPGSTTKEQLERRTGQGTRAATHSTCRRQDFSH